MASLTFGLSRAGWSPQIKDLRSDSGFVWVLNPEFHFDAASGMCHNAQVGDGDWYETLPVFVWIILAVLALIAVSLVVRVISVSYTHLRAHETLMNL
eukprot:524854-Prorocentrum_minimum.AAC.1